MFTSILGKFSYMEFLERTLPLLRTHGKRIGEDYESCPLATEIIKRYSLLKRSYDPMTHILLDEALSKWITKEERLK